MVSRSRTTSGWRSAKMVASRLFSARKPPLSLSSRFTCGNTQMRQQ